ncbi:hypothetical protein B0H21DRAFT_779787 [Amylocystis lapponica]|nr:hypothetical protein B0H21DRAFT_779787 [Amylocystis lapponica]
MSAPAPIPGDFGPAEPIILTEEVPDGLRRASARLQFSPSYTLYRQASLHPAWKKCKHGIVRGLTVGLTWATLTFKIQRKFVEVFLINSPRVTGLSREGIFGYSVPWDVPTYATVFFLSSQVSAILTYCLSHNLRIARERAYDQTIESRGKGSDFWQPYVEEWDVPPRVVAGFDFGRIMGRGLSRLAFRVALLPFDFIPLVGVLFSAWLRALGTARYLHKPYFKAKGMTPEQTSVFIEERKWDYRAFGFAAALLERLPIVGLVFSVSNRIGAAMWAHDLEKRQHYVAAKAVDRALVDSQ